MSYTRVIPHDLFNESKLLKCYGQLALLLLDHPITGVELDHDTSQTEGFQIEQSESDGSLTVWNLTLMIQSGDHYSLYTPYNSREPYPMYLLDADGEEVSVFTEQGQFTKEFKGLVSYKL